MLENIILAITYGLFIIITVVDIRVTISLRKQLKQKELELLKRKVRINNGERTFHIGEKVYCTAITSSMDAFTFGEQMEIRRVEVWGDKTIFVLRNEKGGYGTALLEDIYKTKSEWLDAVNRCVSRLQQ